MSQKRSRNPMPPRRPRESGTFRDSGDLTDPDRVMARLNDRFLEVFPPTLDQDFKLNELLGTNFHEIQSEKDWSILERNFIDHVRKFGIIFMDLEFMPETKIPLMMHVSTALGQVYAFNKDSFSPSPDSFLDMVPKSIIRLFKDETIVKGGSDVGGDFEILRMKVEPIWDTRESMRRHKLLGIFERKTGERTSIGALAQVVGSQDFKEYDLKLFIKIYEENPRDLGKGRGRLNKNDWKNKRFPTNVYKMGKTFTPHQKKYCLLENLACCSFLFFTTMKMIRKDPKRFANKHYIDCLHEMMKPDLDKKFLGDLMKGTGKSKNKNKNKKRRYSSVLAAYDIDQDLSLSENELEDLSRFDESVDTLEYSPTLPTESNATCWPRESGEAVGDVSGFSQSWKNSHEVVSEPRPGPSTLTSPPRTPDNVVSWVTKPPSESSSESSSSDSSSESSSSDSEASMKPLQITISNKRKIVDDEEPSTSSKIPKLDIKEEKKKKKKKGKKFKNKVKTKVKTRVRSKFGPDLLWQQRSPQFPVCDRCGKINHVAEECKEEVNCCYCDSPSHNIFVCTVLHGVCKSCNLRGHTKEGVQFPETKNMLRKSCQAAEGESSFREYYNYFEKNAHHGIHTKHRLKISDRSWEFVGLGFFYFSRRILEIYQRNLPFSYGDLRAKVKSEGILATKTFVEKYSQDFMDYNDEELKGLREAIKGKPRYRSLLKNLFGEK